MKASTQPALLLLLAKPVVTTDQRPAPSSPTATAAMWLRGNGPVKSSPVSANDPLRT